MQSTLAGFRSKKFRVLVATDVAARGLDIKEVELVVMTDPPKDPETYIHRCVAGAATACLSSACSGVHPSQAMVRWCELCQHVACKLSLVMAAGWSAALVAQTRSKPHWLWFWTALDVVGIVVVNVVVFVLCRAAATHIHRPTRMLAPADEACMPWPDTLNSHNLPQEQHGKDPHLASGAVNAGRSPGCLKHGACCRSGRTGRAGSSGTCVVLVDKKKEGLIPLIERKAGLKMQRIGTPQPSDLARVAGLPLGLQCPDFRVQAASGLCWLSAVLQILAAAAPVQLQLVTLDQSNCCV